jgi:hypothetical protein
MARALRLLRRCKLGPGWRAAGLCSAKARSAHPGQTIVRFAGEAAAELLPESDQRRTRGLWRLGVAYSTDPNAAIAREEASRSCAVMIAKTTRLPEESFVLSSQRPGYRGVPEARRRRPLLPGGSVRGEPSQSPLYSARPGSLWAPLRRSAVRRAFSFLPSARRGGPAGSRGPAGFPAPAPGGLRYGAALPLARRSAPD